MHTISTSRFLTISLPLTVAAVAASYFTKSFSFLILPVAFAVSFFLFDYVVTRALWESNTVPPYGHNVQEKSLIFQEKGARRERGVWEPAEFQYPRFAPFTGDITQVKPIPYRPFKWGDYHVTMGIRSMPWNEWIEVDQQFEHFQRIREQRIHTRGQHVVQTLPGTPGIVQSGYPAACELVHELAEYCSRMFPGLYAATRQPRTASSSICGWYGEGKIKDITIIPMGKTYDLDTYGNMDPMTICALLVPEDLAIMVEGMDGRYYFQAGAITIPGSWKLEEKLGMGLDEIHISGGVPQFESKLNLSMARFFKRLPLDKPVVRNNYTFQVVDDHRPEGDLDPTELAWSTTMKGDEDLDIRPGWVVDTEEKVDTKVPVAPSTLWLRTERQTLRRLPRTGAIVFTIRVYQTRIDDLAKEPGVPGRMASAIRSWPEDVARYKARGEFEAILEYLDGCHANQLANGIYVDVE